MNSTMIILLLLHFLTSWTPFLLKLKAALYNTPCPISPPGSPNATSGVSEGASGGAFLFFSCAHDSHTHHCLLVSKLGGCHDPQHIPELARLTSHNPGPDA